MLFPVFKISLGSQSNRLLHFWNVMVLCFFKFIYPRPPFPPIPPPPPRMHGYQYFLRKRLHCEYIFGSWHWQPAGRQSPIYVYSVNPWGMCDEEKSLSGKCKEDRRIRLARHLQPLTTEQEHMSSNPLCGSPLWLKVERPFWLGLSTLI